MAAKSIITDRLQSVDIKEGILNMQFCESKFALKMA
jgi:hypothetical protein